jgi:hypothetical protein
MLKALGKTADEVASALRSQGIQGVPNTIRFLNPIVRYVQGQVTDVRSAHLVNNDLTIDFADGRVQREALPPAVADFLDAFNRGHYPDLILPLAMP